MRKSFEIVCPNGLEIQCSGHDLLDVGVAEAVMGVIGASLHVPVVVVISSSGIRRMLKLAAM